MRTLFGLFAGIALLGVVGCQSTTGKTMGQTVNDANITAAIQGQLTADKMSNFTRIDVDTERGVVTLNGIVKSTEDKDRVARIAKNVDGVKRVNNNLQVQSSPPTMRSN
ncbi:phospholipid-binding protein [Nitrospira sp.]|nr:phospholipid-binding protein [Nitrospira sp.]